MAVNRTEAQVLVEREKVERTAGVARAEISTVRLRRFVPAEAVLEVPSRWAIVSHEFFDVDQDAELVLGSEASLIIEGA